MIFILSLQTECGSPNYPRVLHPEDSAYSYTISQKGMERFIACGMDSAIIYAQNIPIPDLSFDLDLGLTQIKFILSDISFANFHVNKIYIDIPEDNPINAGASGVDIEMKLNWKFQQTSYPYVNDQGAGQILIRNADVKAVADIDCDFDDCPGHLLVNVYRADLTFDILQIVLSGGSSWIYQSLIDLVISAVQDSLSDIISEVIVKGITVLMNDIMKATLNLMQLIQEQQKMIVLYLQ
ncbi:BPI-like_protein [Hexamita inflata]|uniref:BPI-like_protein n=1 Tax=Hexamita inflata TaxID=28002 RepID=A0ABP1JXH9_9EUKA